MKKIAIQGYSGSFHEQAARSFYSRVKDNEEREIDIVECATFDGLYAAIESGRADAAVMAIENTVSGGLLPNFELLREHDIRIKGEIFLRICQNLMVLPGQKIEDIKEVRTHYMAINQTREFFKNYPHIRLVEAEDTAKTAAEISRLGILGVGAVASECAATIYGLEIIAPSIETYKQNFTRFLILDDSLEVPADKINKASICFTLPHKTGALAQALAVLSSYDMNLTRIQSLPIPGREWQYFFYIDITFSSFERYSQALSAVGYLMEDIKIMGEYVKAL